jgi:hypothetical protein
MFDCLVDMSGTPFLQASFDDNVPVIKFLIELKRNTKARNKVKRWLYYQ